MPPEIVEVSCYSGHTYPERPESFRWRDREFRVAEVESAWRQPDGNCFRVRTGDNKRFTLCYNVAKGRWSLTELAGS